jgi:hypothetical protein
MLAPTKRPSAYPMSPEEARETIAGTLAKLGVAQTDLGNVDSTIGRRVDASAPGAAPLPSISIDTASTDEGDTADGDADLMLRGILGRGGMGIVRLAEQRSLRREVAVKRSTKNDAVAIRALVREARITGGLEHPNVVPVHALGVDDEGGPLLVMKRIEGVSWRTLIHEDAHPAWPALLAGHGDRLRAHVEILAQVCRALELAHDRGVIHRDVKPENVMIGRFGEVYLVDWGVALRLDERDQESHAIVGTPGFLAPEMARGNPELVGPHTDVYLLGGTLYEVLTRRPPHDAPNALAALVAALVGAPPSLPDSAPRDLAALVRRAMALAPEERVPSAEAFREGLTRHLASREIDRVLHEGRAALARADEVIAKEGAGASDAYRALIEARFALGSTLRARPDDDARAELDACLVRLVEREIAVRSPAGARAVLGEMTEVPSALEARVDALDRSVQAERDAIADRERARREADSSLSLGAMNNTVASVVALVVVAWFFFVGSRDPLEIWIAGLVGLSAAVFVGRKQLLVNRAARRLTGLLATLLVTPFAITLVALTVSAPMHERSAYSWVAGAGLAMASEITILPKVWPSILVYAIGIVAVLALPETTGLIQPIVILGNAAIFVRALRHHAARSRVAT